MRKVKNKGPPEGALSYAPYKKLIINIKNEYDYDSI